MESHSDFSKCVKNLQDPVKKSKNLQKSVRKTKVIFIGFHYESQQENQKVAGNLQDFDKNLSLLGVLSLS